MALQASDVFIVQQSTGAEALAKVTAYELTEFIEATGGLHYKGSANFLDAAEEPANPQIGDMWLNTAPNVGTFAWTYRPGSPGATALPSQKAVWNGAYWDILAADDSASYLTEVTGTLPINVDTPLGAFTERNITIDNATTAAPGAVQLATQDDLDSSSTTSVVTADQLATVIADVDQIQTDISSLGPGTVTQVLSASPGDPITITDSTTTPTIAIKDASTTEKGVVTLATQDDVTGSVAGKVVTSDLTIDGGVYAFAPDLVDNWVSMCSGAAPAGAYLKAFDGDINTPSNGCVPSTGSTVSFIPNSEISGTVTVYVRSSFESSLPANSFTVNGNDYTDLIKSEAPGDIDSVYKLEIPETSINITQGITWFRLDGFAFVSMHGISVGGSMLINS